MPGAASHGNIKSRRFEPRTSPILRMPAHVNKNIPASTGQAQSIASDESARKILILALPGDDLTAHQLPS